MPKSKTKKEKSIFSNIYGLEVKESEDDSLVRGGYIATTHLDSGFHDCEKDTWIRDQIAKETLDLWAQEINEGNPRVNKVSINHNRQPHVAGVAVRGSAEVIELNDGEFGLYADTFIDSTREDFSDTKYRLDNGLLDSFSIEFTTRDQASGEYLSGAVEESVVGNGIVRTLLPGTQLEGFTLASQPMNENAVMIKEVVKTIKKIKEVTKMTEKKEIKEEPVVEEPKAEPEAPAEPAPAEEPKEEAPEEAKERKEFEAFKKMRSEVKRKDELDLMKGEIIAGIKEDLQTEKVEEKVKVNDGKIESKELKDFSEAIKIDSKMSTDSMVSMAGKMADLCGFTDKGDIPSTKSAESRQYSFEVKMDGAKHILECKGLGITTNQNTDTDYLLSAAELSDVFDPVIFNILNQKTTTWNLLPKEDKSTKGNNQVQFALKITANTTAGAYTGNAVNLGAVGRLKYQTKFKKYQVGVEVDGDMIASARGGPVGDVFAKEVMDSTEDMMSVINIALFAEVGLESAAGVIGFEYITDQAGNTTLYNLARTQANGLASTTTTDNYINGSGNRITLANLRAAKRKAVGTEGADLNNCIFVTSFVQGDKFRGIYDSQQRTVPTSSRFGFEGRPEFDGMPIFEDKDCNDDDWFLIDLTTHKIAIWVPPTLEKLGKDSDSEKGFIKSYFATYNKAPRRMVQIYNNEV